MPNATSLQQLVDAAYAEAIKLKIKQAFFNWLDDNNHAELSYGESSKLIASVKWILMTSWASQAYCAIMAEEHNSFQYRLFQKTRCLHTANDSDDGKIQPVDLKDYQGPPPVNIDLSSMNPVTIPVESASPENANDEIDEAIEFH